MDHGGQCEREGRVMSQVEMGGVDLCDNLPSPEALTAQTRNLNETNMVTQKTSLSLSQREDMDGLIRKVSLSNNGNGIEGEQEKEGYTGGGREEDEEEEDIDEVMKEEEEEEVSEGSSSLILCQSPDAAMTDSSETGSLLETPYPFSPGTSPEPTSPVIPIISPETACPIRQVAQRQNDVKVESNTADIQSVASKTGSMILGPTFTTGPIDSGALTVTSGARLTSPPGHKCTPETTDSLARSTDLTTEHFTSGGISRSNAGSITSTAESLTESGYTTKLNTSTGIGPMSPTSGPPTFTTGPMTTGTESTSSTGFISSTREQITSTSVPTCFSGSTCATGPVPSPALLESLEQLAQKGDDTHLPQYLHQIAEAFVLHEDYQWALRCVQLERLYHQRVLDNLKALQEQWESQCSRTSPDLAPQHLDTLKHICQSHSRPRAKDAACVSLDVCRPKVEEGGAPSSCNSVTQVDRGMEQRAEDLSCFQGSHPVKPSFNLIDRLNSHETLEKDREDPDRELFAGRDGFHGSQLTDRQRSNREGGEGEGGAGHTISVIGNELHPSTAGEMDQSKPTEQQGGDVGLAQEREAKGEEGERDEEEVVALEMEDEGEGEEEEKLKEEDPPCQEAFPVETVVGGTEVEEQLHQEALAEEKLHETQEIAETLLFQEDHFPQEAHVQQRDLVEEEEEEEDEYEVEHADIIREAASLDNMAKLITVEEVFPASGLVSILKRRGVGVDKVCVSAIPEPQPDKPPATRRVRFIVPDDGYEHDVGGGDSCLLLFLLCLVTVVISVGGTALYCALGDSHSSVCQDFSRNADFYFSQIQRGISHIQHWLSPGS